MDRIDFYTPFVSKIFLMSKQPTFVAFCYTTCQIAPVFHITTDLPDAFYNYSYTYDQKPNFSMDIESYQLSFFQTFRNCTQDCNQKDVPKFQEGGVSVLVLVFIYFFFRNIKQPLYFTSDSFHTILWVKYKVKEVSLILVICNKRFGLAMSLHFLSGQWRIKYLQMVSHHQYLRRIFQNKTNCCLKCIALMVFRCLTSKAMTAGHFSNLSGSRSGKTLTPKKMM